MDYHRLWIISMMCVFIRQAIGGTVEFDVLVLVPLTGEKVGEGEGRGRAQLEGVRSALRSKGYNVTRGHTMTTASGYHGNQDLSHLHIFYQDTQCDRAQEDAAILKHLSLTPSRRLIVLGGYCMTSDTQYVTSVQDSLVLRQNLPQVLFDIAPSHNHVTSGTLISLRPSITHAYPQLADWLKTNSFNQVAYIRTKPDSQEMRPGLGDYLVSNNINISIDLYLHQTQLPVLLQESKSRVVVVESEGTTDVDALCQLLYVTKETPGRYVWVVMVTDAMVHLQGRSQICQFLEEEEPDVYFFNVETSLPTAKRYNDVLINVLKSARLHLTPITYDAAAFAFDATTLVLQTIETFRHVGSTVSSQQFTDRFIRQLTRQPQTLATGEISFDKHGRRRVPVDVMSFKGEFIVPINASGHYLGNATVINQKEIDGIPLVVLVVMASLAFLGLMYTAAIFTFNIVKRNDRMIKMTSPNINLIILLGASMGYVAMVTLGLDSTLVPLETMSTLVQTSTFLLAIGYTLVFGSLFAKAWRVFFIFKNLNANGKNTRDEHLLLGIILLVVADMVVLIPWAVVDPIRCTHIYLSTSYQESPPADIIHEQDVCTSEQLIIWLFVLFFLKAIVLLAGFYFTYQARHVTLPTLRDAKHVYVLIYTVVVLGVISLPLLLTPRISSTVKYSTGALIVFTAVTAAISLAFVPKMYYVWMRAEKNPQESVRFHFSESLRRTQKNLASCLCFGAPEEEDKYAQQVLGSEIETLKRTIKEKEATIRELTDRLYFGTEKKLHEYISSPRNRPIYRPEPLRPVPTPQQQLHQSQTTERSPDHDQMNQDGGTRSEQCDVNMDDSADSCDSMYRSYSQTSQRSRQGDSKLTSHPSASRTVSAPLMSLSVRGLKENNSKIAAQVANNLDTPLKERYHHPAMLDHSIHQEQYDSPGCNSTRNGTMLTDITLSPKYNSPSPNHDSAIDNNSPSSINSDSQTFQKELSLHPDDHAAMNAIWNRQGKLDLEAIEREAMRLDSSQGSKSIQMESPQVHDQGFLHTHSPYMTQTEHPYSVRKVKRNSTYNSPHYNHHQSHSPHYNHHQSHSPHHGYNHNQSHSPHHDYNHHQSHSPHHDYNHHNSHNDNHYDTHSPHHEEYGMHYVDEGEDYHESHIAEYVNYPPPNDHNYYSHDHQEGYYEDEVNVSQI